MADSLDLPDVSLEETERDGKRYVLDPVRRKFVRLTPEEWVRQKMLVFLTHVLQVPPALVVVEKSFRFNGMPRRADIVVHDRHGDPLILVECKAPGVSLTQQVFDQVGRYNAVVGARYVIVTNGLLHYCYLWGREEGDSTFISELPPFSQLGSH